MLISTPLLLFTRVIFCLPSNTDQFSQNVLQNLKNKLQRLQNECLRVCHRSDRFTYNYELHKRSKVLPLRLRHKMSTCLMVYKKIQSDPKIIYHSQRTGNRSGGTFIVKVPKPNKETFKRAISYNAPVTWNNLPSVIRNSNNVATFKRRLKRYLEDIFCQDGYV